MRRSWQTKGRDGAAVQRNISHKHELLAGDIVKVRSRMLELREKSLRFAHDIGNVLSRSWRAKANRAVPLTVAWDWHSR